LINKKTGLRNPRVWDYIALNAKDEISRGGWYSSFGGTPFSSEEMDQYVDNTVNKLKPYLSPDKSVVEIGCASGLTMFAIAPFVKTYIGTDMAKENLRFDQERIDNNGLSNIKLIQCAADEICDCIPHVVDVVIINSVCQYFPGMEYFEDVFEQCIKILKNDGILYLGDILDKDKMDYFIKELDIYKENNPNQGKVKTDRSDELWISRTYFEGLSDKNKCVDKVEITNKIGNISNELIKYRYDVVIKINKNEEE